MADEVGAVQSIDDPIMVGDALESNGITIPGDSNGALWEYHERGRINGIPVVEADRGLAVDDPDAIQAMFELISVPHIRVLNITAAADDQGAAEYSQILNKQQEGSVIVVDAAREFNAATGSFLLWLQYNEVSYRLHPRYEYMRGELTGE